MDVDVGHTLIRELGLRNKMGLVLINHRVCYYNTPMFPQLALFSFFLDKFKMLL